MRLQQPAAQQRRWWEVRTLLWAALLVLCGIGAWITFVPEVRSSLRVTIAEPSVTVINSLAGWAGWPALALASLAGVLTVPLVRRMGIGRAGTQIDSIYCRGELTKRAGGPF